LSLEPWKKALRYGSPRVDTPTIRCVSSTRTEQLIRIAWVAGLHTGPSARCGRFDRLPCHARSLTPDGLFVESIRSVDHSPEVAMHFGQRSRRIWPGWPPALAFLAAITGKPSRRPSHARPPTMASLTIGPSRPDLRLSRARPPTLAGLTGRSASDGHGQPLMVSLCPLSQHLAGKTLPRPFAAFDKTTETVV
jgi:hypothetical protein